MDGQMRMVSCRAKGWKRKMPMTNPEIREALAVCEAAAQHFTEIRSGEPVLNEVWNRQVAFMESARAHYAEALRELPEARAEIQRLRAEVDGAERACIEDKRQLYHRIEELETEVERWRSNADCERERVRELEARKEIESLVRHEKQVTCSHPVEAEARIYWEGDSGSCGRAWVCAECLLARITELEAELKAYQEGFHRHDGPLDFVAEV